MKTLSQLKSELNAKSLEFAEKAKTTTGDEAQLLQGLSMGLWFASAYVGAYAQDGEWEMQPMPEGVALVNMIPQYHGVSVMWGQIASSDDKIRVGASS